MSAFFRFFFALIAVLALGIGSAQAQIEQRSRDDDGGRPEEDNISGSRDDPSLLHFAATLAGGGSEEGGGEVDESENAVSNHPSRLSTSRDKPMLTADVYPNPASDFVQINLGAETDVVLTLHNLVGKEVYRFAGTLKTHRIALDAFNPGVYFVTAYTESERIVKKVRVTP
ncbi:MAG: T9SS type A sorting domain-containing protein [Bacteroidetes bacterium]|nr:T9SS type A sorting domain-containing protein [Bacteroidota bacterium]